MNAPVEEESWHQLPLLELLARLKGRLTSRQMRLAACAVARGMQVTDARRHREAIALAEAFADGQASPHQLAAARFGARSLQGQIFWLVCWPPGADDWDRFKQAVDVALLYSGIARENFGAAELFHHAANLIRDIAGNPYQPVFVDPLWQSHPEVQCLAQAIYQQRDFASLPVLGDALEEAGCTDPRLLDHARSPGPHVLGCWLLDSILKKNPAP